MTPKATKAHEAAIKAVMQRSALHLFEPHPPGGITEAEAHMEAHQYLIDVIKLCTHGGQRDLSEKLLAIAADLREPWWLARWRA